MKRMNIRPEYSAQGMNAPVNPALSWALEYLKEQSPLSQRWSRIRAADQGCGKLRHLRVLRPEFARLYLVDIRAQVDRIHNIAGRKMTIRDYVKTLPKEGAALHIVYADEFRNKSLSLDVIFSVCVFDVVTKRLRRELIFSAWKNLRRGGYYIVIIPRNDSSILQRCSPENAYQDGYVFAHHGIHTFYCNFRDTKKIFLQLSRNGFKLEKDLSKYRYICAILKKSR